MIQSTPIRASVNTLVLYVKLLLSTLISFFSIPLLLRALGAENYGIFCVVGGVIALLMFLSFSMTTATNRFLSVAEGRIDNEEVRQKTFNLCLFLHIAIALLITLSLEILAFFFWDKVLNIAPDRQFAAKIVYQTIVFTTGLSIATIPYNGILLAKERLIFFSIATLAVSIAKLGITILLFSISSDRLIAYALLLLVIHLFERIAYIAYAHHVATLHYDFRKLDHALIREMVCFFGWSMTINFSYPAVVNGTSILLNKFFGVLVNAAEGIALQVSGQLNAVCGNLLNAVSPIIMKREGGAKSDEALAITITTCRLSTYLLSLAVTAVFLELPYLLKLWLKTVPTYTVIFCRLILLRIFVEQITLPLEILMNACGKIKWMQIFTAIIHLFTLGVEFMILWYGAPPWSVYCCMIGMLIAVGTIRVICVSAQYHLKIVDFLFGTLLRIFGVFSCGLLSIIWIPHCMKPSLLRCGVSFGISVCTIFIAIFIFGLGEKEKFLLNNWLQKLKGKVCKRS